MIKLSNNFKMFFLVNVLLILFFLLILLISGCDKKQGIVSEKEQVESVEKKEEDFPKDEKRVFKKIDCTFLNTEVDLHKHGVVKLPAKGLVVMESHYVTGDDNFKFKEWPKSVDDKIKDHLEKSKALMIKEFGIEVPYANRWAKEWTPSEGGHIGQAAVGDYRTDLLSEMFQGNMYFKKLPKKGTKFLFKNGENAVVVQMGLEIGPAATKYIAGVTVEAYHFLKAEGVNVELGELKDQSISVGPVECFK